MLAGESSLWYEAGIKKMEHQDRSVLDNIGFDTNPDDLCFFAQIDKDHSTMIVLLYVDESSFSCHRHEATTWMRTEFTERFEAGPGWC